jgi:hypothetical protein
MFILGVNNQICEYIVHFCAEFHLYVTTFIPMPLTGEAEFSSNFRSHKGFSRHETSGRLAPFQVDCMIGDGEFKAFFLKIASDQS